MTTKAGSVRLDSADGRSVVGTTVAGSAVAMLTATVVNVALPALADDLDATSGQQQWVVNGYLLAIASLILIGGNLGDRYGRLRLYRIGTVWFGAASLLCALAPTIEMLIGARLLQGIGGALLTPGSLAIIEATLHPDDRGRGVGQWSGLSGVAGAVGPLVGGLLVDFSWRWVFLLNLPVALFVLVLSQRVPESIDQEARNEPLDIAGAGLTAVVLGGASFALIEGPANGFGFLTWVAVVAATTGLGVLVVHERNQSQPMVPIDLFSIRPFVAANVVTLLVYGGMGVVFFLLSLQLQVTLGWRPVVAGAALLPVTGLMLALSSRAGDLAQKIGPRWPLTFGPILIAAGMLLLSRVDQGDTYVGNVLPGVSVFGLGLAASVAPVTATALGSIPDERSGAASGLNNAVSRSGQLLTIAAIPPLVGLTGDALSDAERLSAGFDDAMLLGAAFVLAGALAAALLFQSDDLDDSGQPAAAGLEKRSDDCSRRYHCGVESPQLVRR